MSLYYAENGKRYVPKYGPTMTKQAFQDACDVNKILKKAQKMGGLAHVQKYPEEVYGEFDGTFDLLTAHERLDRARQIFDELPSEVRGEFGNNALDFVTWAAKLPPGELVQRIPQIAEPGTYFPNPVRQGGQGAGAATAPNTEVSASPPSEASVAADTGAPAPPNEDAGN